MSIHHISIFVCCLSFVYAFKGNEMIFCFVDLLMIYNYHPCEWHERCICKYEFGYYCNQTLLYQSKKGVFGHHNNCFCFSYAVYIFLIHLLFYKIIEAKIKKNLVYVVYICSFPFITVKKI